VDSQLPVVHERGLGRKSCNNVIVIIWGWWRPSFFFTSRLFDVFQWRQSGAVEFVMVSQSSLSLFTFLRSFWSLRTRRL
jgi:hypothetical protein